MNVDKIIIEGLVERTDYQTACRYARQTMQIYRRAVLNPAHFASTSQYRRAFIMSYLFYKHYLLNHKVPPDIATTNSKGHRPGVLKDALGKATDKCEHIIDRQLDATFPASDPPSWTLGASLVSQHNRH